MLCSNGLLGRVTRTEVRSNTTLVRIVTTAYPLNHHSVNTTNGSGTGSIASTAFADIDGHSVLSIGYPASGVREFTRREFDLVGNLKTEAHTSDTNGTQKVWESTIYSYDGANRLRTKTDRDSALTLYDYDLAGNLT